MSVQVSYPGIYLQEVPSSTHNVVGATTSATAFVGFFARGPMNAAVRVDSLAAFNRVFGGLDTRSEASYGLWQFFNNGGSEAFVIRVAQGSGTGQNTATAASVQVGVTEPTATEFSQQATAKAVEAQTYAQQAWVAVYGAGPTSPPTSTGAQGDLAHAAKAAQDAADATLKAVDSIGEAITFVGATAAALEMDLGKLSPTMLQDTWNAAKQAAAQARDAATAASDAALAAQAAASIDASPPATPTQQYEDMGQAAVAKAQAAAAAAADAAWQAYAAAEAAEEAAAAAEAELAGPSLLINAANPGAWGNCVRVFIQNSRLANSKAPPEAFDLFVCEIAQARGKVTVLSREVYRSLVLDPSSASNASAVVNANSQLINVTFVGGWLPGATPHPNDGTSGQTPVAAWTTLANGSDGKLPGAGDIAPTNGTDGLFALDGIAPSVFNILCIPDTGRLSAAEANQIFTAATSYCGDKQAVYIFDLPATLNTVGKVLAAVQTSYSGEDKASVATYFPRLQIADPLNGYRMREVGPSGTMAGVYARTDGSRGVWKAPAGIGATLEGADVALVIGDDDNGQLNQIGVNVLRAFPVYGPVAWGARTLAGADLLDSQWKYINVRRLVDYIEQSLIQSLKWVVFEPNDEATWGQIRFQVGSFLSGLFADGAFAGSTPDQSFFVACDATTTTASDMAAGIVNIIVGVAPAKPAEFVILQIEQMAGGAAG